MMPPLTRRLNPILTLPILVTVLAFKIQVHGQSSHTQQELHDSQSDTTNASLRLPPGYQTSLRHQAPRSAYDLNPTEGNSIAAASAAAVQVSKKRRHANDNLHFSNTNQKQRRTIDGLKKEKDRLRKKVTRSQTKIGVLEADLADTQAKERAAANRRAQDEQREKEKAENGRLTNIPQQTDLAWPSTRGVTKEVLRDQLKKYRQLLDKPEFLGNISGNKESLAEQYTKAVESWINKQTELEGGCPR